MSLRPESDLPPTSRGGHSSDRFLDQRTLSLDTVEVRSVPDGVRVWPEVNLLVVEDDSLQRRVLVRRFNLAGVARVTEASNGKEAIEQLNKDPTLNVVVTDLDMPHLDGLGLIRALSARVQPVAVALHSAMDASLLTCAELVSREHRVRFLGILTKPARSEDLTHVLARAMAVLAQEQRPTPPPFDLAEILRGVQAKEFEPFFQPKIRLSDGVVVGAEALARWRHPQHGLVAPIRFIDVLESAGELGLLTSHILQESLTQAARWRAYAPHVGVAVNLSLSYLASRDASEAIADVAHTAGLPSHAVSLEVTESVAMNNVGACLENLARLRMRGFRLSADDFGVGYSSLELLMRVPFQEVKLDRQFVTRVTPGSREAIVLEAVVPLARRLGMSTVAEGVESRAEWDYLRELGCDNAQGYWMAKPMAAEAFQTWLSRLSTAAPLFR